MEAADDPDERARRAAAAAVVGRLERGMTIGLGSGRAVWRVIDEIRSRWPDGAPLRAVCASEVTARRAATAQVPLIATDGTERPQLAIDGADEVDPQLRLIKGGGAALLREKLVIVASDRFVVVAETPKRVERLGEHRTLPVEVIRFSWQDTRRRLEQLVPEVALRRSEEGEPIVTDEGHYLLDCVLPAQGDVEALARALKAVVGVVEHGLFIGLAHEALLGAPDGSVERLVRGPHR